jgi:hypothetical protein
LIDKVAPDPAASDKTHRLFSHLLFCKYWQDVAANKAKSDFVCILFISMFFSSYLTTALIV